MAKCANCAAEVGLHDFCAVCGAPAPRTEPVDIPTEHKRRVVIAAQLHPAPFWQRGLAAAIDAGAVFVYLAVIVTPVTLAIQLGPGSAAYNGGGLTALLLRVLIWVLTLVVPLLYLTVTESWTGQSFGKRTMRLRAVGYPGARPLPRGRAALRALGRIPSLLAAGLGYAAAGRDPLRRAWHDQWAHAIVIELEPPNISKPDPATTTSRPREEPAREADRGGRGGF